uniref:Galaxin-like repeats domain-containing protein n=1 Tax=Lepisosteus oculatus TaxID=7918 RepID=W5NCD0_LEPOC
GSACCGFSTFDPAWQTCCNAQIVNITGKLSGLISQCCGSEPYNPRYQVCCGGKLWDQQPGLRCCGQALYNITSELCIHHLSKVIKKETPHALLCGDRQYDNETHFCCEDLNVYTRTVRCCGNASTPYRTYNPLNASCCNALPEHMRSDFIGTIGSTRKVEKTCCNGTVHETTGTALNGGRCCNGKGYNPETDFCCSGQTHELSEWQVSPQRLGEGSYLQNDGGLICCNHTLHRVSAGERECQGGIPYNPALETVCAGLVHRTTHEHCCGQHTYRPDTEVCCRGRRQPWPRHHSQAECCGAWAYDPLDPETRCCGDTLHRVPRGAASLRCCGSLLVDTDTHSCCASETQQVSFRRAPGLACCGHTPYNTSRESCCAHRLS